MIRDQFQTVRELHVGEESFRFWSLPALADQGFARIEKLPYSYRILLEGLLRHQGQVGFSEKTVSQLASWKPGDGFPPIPFLPARILLQDFTGIPVLNDLTSFRAALQKLGIDPGRVDLKIPCDLVVDHSLQVDDSGCERAQKVNEELEFHRNRERYQFLRWCQCAYRNLRIIPPGSGIIHQVNLEYLASVVASGQDEDGALWAFPDTVLGSDSHTTMVNGLGVLCWGVGGIEAISALLGVASEIVLPGVIGLKLSGDLPYGLTPTDLTLHITSILRRTGVVGKIIEVFGSSLKVLSAEDRCMISNMTPESGATATFFQVDDLTLNYLRLTGRDEKQVRLVEAYCKEQGLFRSETERSVDYAQVVEVDISQLLPVIAGPKRPFDLIPVSKMRNNISALLSSSKEKNLVSEKKNFDPGYVTIQQKNEDVKIPQGAVVLAAITSCTNTSNPVGILGAGLLARKAVEKGLSVPPWVKTNLAPGSRVVTHYLQRAGLLPFLEKLGFFIVGYGCTTCIGNSGPLPAAIEKAVEQEGLYACAVLSGNRNFEGRIHRSVKASFLASPLMVIACALAGRMDFDFASQPLGHDRDGKEIFLADIWPNSEEIRSTIQTFIHPEIYKENYRDILTRNAQWNGLDCPMGITYPWQAQSAYLQEPPFLENKQSRDSSYDIKNARVLAYFQDSITTDHISPAGEIDPTSPAWKYLREEGVEPGDVNSYGAYRANHEVMRRGTFANPKLNNLLSGGKHGGYTQQFPGGEVVTIFEAAEGYKQDNTALIILAGKNYGTGSSRDWAAKGPALLGVKAILAQSFERIHRANLVMMGILPLQFLEGENAQSLGLSGQETYTLTGIDALKGAGQKMQVVARTDNGNCLEFTTLCRIDTLLELEYYCDGGILSYILDRIKNDE
jgi:aconitate hydratase